MIRTLLTIAGACLALPLLAALQEKEVEYTHGDEALQGYMVWDEAAAAKGKLPTVLIVHQWMGLGDYEKARARMLAEMGYLAFAIDMYGKGTRAESREQARALTTKFRGDRQLMRSRANAALEHARTLPQADAGRIAAIGYCFGGGVVLELARSGAELAGVVSFHGNLDTPNAADAKQSKAAILVCHGAADSSVKMDQVVAFVEEMEATDVDWYMTIYADAVHGFTHFDDESRHDEVADERSWREMQEFFAEIFAK